MREIISSNTQINFTSKFSATSIFSLIVVAVGLYLAFGYGLKYGVDFRGGAEIQVKFSQSVGSEDIRKTLKEAKVNGQVQSIGEAIENEFLVKIAATGESRDLNIITQKTAELLNNKMSDKGPEIRKTDIVGPKAGAQLRVSGFQAMMWALLAIMAYIALRFEIKYSPGAIVALIHDVTIILGIFALTQREFTLQIVAALLAVIGYSVNDTVVVYDRVREHEMKFSGRSLAEHINNAVNETLSRTLLTSGTTLFVGLAMFFFGGNSIHDFFFAICLGVIIGTYSSIFVAAPVTLLFDHLNKNWGSSK